MRPSRQTSSPDRRSFAAARSSPDQFARPKVLRRCPDESPDRGSFATARTSRQTQFARPKVLRRWPQFARPEFARPKVLRRCPDLSPDRRSFAAARMSPDRRSFAAARTSRHTEGPSPRPGPVARPKVLRRGPVSCRQTCRQTEGPSPWPGFHLSPDRVASPKVLRCGPRVARPKVLRRGPVSNCRQTVSPVRSSFGAARRRRRGSSRVGRDGPQSRRAWTDGRDAAWPCGVPTVFSEPSLCGSAVAPSQSAERSS